VVVGFDGSDHARRALQWAVRHTPASCRIEVVHAYDPEQVTGAGVPALHAEHLASQSSELLAQAVDAAQAGADNGERELIASSQLGDPRLVLRREGHLADALVVGVRGHRPMVELLVGSVTTALVERPDVVTVVVR
jgi:nucleotide-binding universal stress UspA family protein